MLTIIAVCAALVVAAVLVSARWAYTSATGSTDLASVELDPIFERRDQLVWISALLVAAVAGLVGSRRGAGPSGDFDSRRSVLLGTVALVGLATSAAWADGFIGWSRASLLVALLLAPALLLAVGPSELADRAVRYSWPAVAVLGACLYVPALWQTPRGLYEPWHASHIIDEVLGPAAGSLPLVDYVPQYGGLLGLPLVPVSGLVAQDVAGWVTAYMSLLSILTVVLLCAIAALMLPPGRRMLAPLLILPGLLMKPTEPGALFPPGLQGLYQALPGRSLLPAAVGLVLLLAVHRPARRTRWLWVGATAGIAALNNFESGVPASLAAVVVIVALRNWRALAAFAGAWMAVPVIYTLAVLASGGRPRFDYWIAFTVEFAGGFGTLPMPVYGNFVLILAVLTASTASGFAVLCRSARDQPSVAAVGGFFFGAWGLMMFPYYVTRSSSFGQLQFFLIPASLAAVWLLVCAVEVARAPRRGRFVNLGLLLCVLPSAVFLSGLIKAPSPADEWLRLSGLHGDIAEFRSTAWVPEPVVGRAQAADISAAAAGAEGPVGVFFSSGNIASLESGYPNAAVLAAPEEMLPNRPWVETRETDTGNASFRRMQCQSLQSSPLNTVIADARLARALQCPGFRHERGQGNLVVVTRRGT